MRSPSESLRDRGQGADHSGLLLRVAGALFVHAALGVMLRGAEAALRVARLLPLLGRLLLDDLPGFGGRPSSPTAARIRPISSDDRAAKTARFLGRSGKARLADEQDADNFAVGQDRLVNREVRRVEDSRAPR